MTEAPAAQRRRGWPGCLGRIVVAIAAAVALVIAIGLIFDQGDDADQPVRGFNAGRAESFERADVDQFEAQHAYVTRLQDGEFVVLYDRSPREQAIAGGDCRVIYNEDATTGAAEQLPGFAGAFIEDCDGIFAAWLADGTRAFGGGFGDLDRFEYEIDERGDLIVNLERRTCTKSTAGVAPYREATCSGRAD